MYKVYCDGHTIHDPSMNDINWMLISPVITKEANRADSFTFAIPKTHANADKLQQLKSVIEVYEDDRRIFRGRILNEAKDWNDTKTVVCEGGLALLNDTIKRPYQTQTLSAAAYFRWLITYHNNLAPSDKKFTCRNVTVPGSLTIPENAAYPTIWHELENNLLNQFGGYLFCDYDDDEGRYVIDYLEDSPYHASQIIRFGENLIDLERETKGEDIITRLIPLGCKLDDIASSGGPVGGYGEKRLTIENVNDGKDYLVNTAAETIYGQIWGVEIYDNIDSASALMTKGQQSLALRSQGMASIRFTAVDLHILDSDIDSLDFMSYVTLEDTVHNVSGEYLVTKKTIDLADPAKGTITIGDETKGISQKYSGASAQIQKIDNRIQKTYTANDGSNTTTMSATGITITDGTNTTTLSAGMGKRVHSNGTEQSLSSGTTLQNLESFELTRGTWVVSVSARFASNATGRRAVNMSDSSGGSAINAFWGDGSAAVNGAYTYLRMASTVRVTDATHTYYINGYQNSGSALSVVAAYDAVRIF